MKYLFIVILFFFVFAQSGCYYDKAEILNAGIICDTATVTYSASVNPVLTANCTGCHSGANAPNGIRLDAYAGVKAVASSGRLLGSITHSQGFSPMPKNGNKLNDCSINKVRIWIAGGSPDN